ncbi:MAG TPA: DUF3108 domain-containing protein [Gemmatimonadaceae bacterium]|nr:DUF3108 domain-containing protein [Gemmatimonadaceae bacterium]
MKHAVALALVVLGSARAVPQTSTPTVSAPVPPADTPPVPWAKGEYLEYTLKVGFISAGSGRMRVVGQDTVRGRMAWRLSFNVTGGFLFAHVNDSYDSWMDVQTLNSLRFLQDISEAGYKRKRNYEIFPDRSTYSEGGKEEQKSVDNPLDDASFFFFVRQIPLEVDSQYTFNRYFNPNSNPVIIKVERKETITVPAGTFPAIVIQPVIKAGGLFGEGGHAEIWLSDDNRRMLLQMKTRVPVIGSLNLYLRKYRNTQEISPPPAKTP